MTSTLAHTLGRLSAAHWWAFVCVSVYGYVCVLVHIFIRDSLTFGLRAGRALLIVLCWYWFPCGKHNWKVPRPPKPAHTNTHHSHNVRTAPRLHVRPIRTLSHTYTHKHILILCKHLTHIEHTLEDRLAPLTESANDRPASSCTKPHYRNLFMLVETDLHLIYSALRT